MFPKTRYCVAIDGVIAYYEAYSSKWVAEQSPRDAWATNDPKAGDVLDVRVIGHASDNTWRVVVVEVEDGWVKRVSVKPR